MIDKRECTVWTVYIHIVPINLTGYDHDKYYVGITSRKTYERWRGGCGYIKNEHFYRAIKKYGWKNIYHEVIANNLTKNEAIEMEKFLIKKLNSYDYNYGYNKSTGGEGSPGIIGEKNGMYGKHHSEEAKKKISDIHKGKKISEEQKKILSEKTKKMWQSDEYRISHTGKNHGCYGRTGDKHPMFGKHGAEIKNSKQIVCLTNGYVYESAVEAAKHINGNNSKISMCARGERKTSGIDKDGNKLTWKYYSDYLKENNLTDAEARKSLFFIT